MFIIPSARVTCGARHQVAAERADLSAQTHAEALLRRATASSRRNVRWSGDAAVFRSVRAPRRSPQRRAPPSPSLRSTGPCTADSHRPQACATSIWLLSCPQPCLCFRNSNRVPLFRPVPACMFRTVQTASARMALVLPNTSRKPKGENSRTKDFQSGRPCKRFAGGSVSRAPSRSSTNEHNDRKLAARRNP
ncbi:unnamed protein product [Prorocentrum cordatum]|uniref:Uncharacterized protein n=1 Tax=Prorocentrum cordatum TaxID=2364126 RepID=A0ABN9TYL8_9DINO|nr:unnamed protein product [Polarella glacialis]